MNDTHHDGHDGGKQHGSTRTRAEERAEQVKAPSRAELLERVRQLETELETTKAKSEEHLYNWQRSAADFANYKRRTDEDRATITQFGNALLIGKLLGVLDDFDRALENVPAEAHDAWIEGVKLVERKLRGVLESEGVTAIEALNQPFDPNLHEAVAHEATADHPDNHVIGEVQRGYKLHDRVIRPSLVRVANNPKEH
ncbi:MAG TPA: nucleotide exchange factor GrpE [Candidatus Limnocylindria bacterium]|jgi:molecular chaperone GrpE|nr:nucleotide exchange factor GrpE [Candidatus Limnocylindria bacterium]